MRIGAASADNSTPPVAIVGFVLSFIIPLAGFICSIIGMNKCKKENRPGHGIALAGLIISIVMWVINTIVSFGFLGYLFEYLENTNIIS